MYKHAGIITKGYRPIRESAEKSNGIVYLGQQFVLTLSILLKLKLTVYLRIGNIYIYIYKLLASLLLLATFLVGGLLK